MIIALTGKMGAGKTTAAKLICEAYFHQEPKIIKFASPLYDMQEYVYRRIASVHKRKEGFQKDRNLLQWLGTEWGRETIGKDLWVDLWKQDVTAFMSRNPKAIVVCDDLRFDNEAEAVKSLGGLIVEIVNDRLPLSSAHPSESGISQGFEPLLVQNHSTTVDLEQNLLKIIKDFAARRGSKE